ncbi:sulfite exporter TauE/SafE family protein [Desulfovibrio litoralis]|uniref:Probable membrane transporter protein n=1 Tax=Desulfovibrio litoralis DSM 11393 TaxID=1121455 RepID=A0A1M7SPE1_9BACT|nr:sulfite exporter TauE/SafE family protein [Desulfovibrio litoralis]SHN60320.1 hypothetical protein SAMN02745728_01116 [Desulfovibrio litoralis DSM 11393]
MSITEISIVAFAGLCSGIIKNGVGVGSGIFLLPTLSLAFPAKVALSLGAPLMLASDVIGMRYYWKQWINTPELMRILLSAIPGLILGTILLPIIPGKLFNLSVGIFGMFYAVGMLFPSFLPIVLLKKLFAVINVKYADKQIYIYGAMGGVATVLAHAGGLVWSLYLVTRNLDKRVFVATIVVMFFITNTYKTIAYMYIDMLTKDMLLSIIPAIPFVFLGSYLGNLANKKLNNVLFRKLVLVTIFIVSLKMCF